MVHDRLIRLAHGSPELGGPGVPGEVPSEHMQIVGGFPDAGGTVRPRWPESTDLFEYLAATLIAAGGGVVNTSQIDMRDYDRLYLIMERTAGTGNLIDIILVEDVTGNERTIKVSAETLGGAGVDNVYSDVGITSGFRMVMLNNLLGMTGVLQITNQDGVDSATWRIRGRRSLRINYTS